jgi:alpha-mannosidase
MRLRRCWSVLVVIALASVSLAQATAPSKTPGARKKTASAAPAPDLTKQPTLYVVPYAHLDTQWRWEYPQVIREYLSKTMRDNFALFEKYPHYVFNFSGANRYRMMKEYYPADYERLKGYVAQGRWFPSGSSMEENDVNNPSAESIIRQVLYGKEYFRKDFGKTSAEYMLPDCFGFPASLPSILAHAGIKGFSTQKLSWHSGSRVGGPDSPEQTPVGIPFNVGVWEGLDGHSVIAALNATDYTGDIDQDISKSPSNAQLVDWPKRVEIDGKASGVYADFRYYGVGDTGGAAREADVSLMEAILTKGKAVLPPVRKDNEPRLQLPPLGTPVQVGNGPLHIVQVPADRMFLDLTPQLTAKMPRYKGDLELTEHSAGSLTSQAYQKRWNRRNEIFADAAERASVAAEWLGGRSYPLARLTNAWTLVMAGQFHDIIPGTSTPRAFEFSWNDAQIAQNQFVSVLTNAVASVASTLDTQAQGTPLVVYNPLNIQREDLVEAEWRGDANVNVVGPDGKSVPAQISNGKLIFAAKVPSVGFAVYDVRPGAVSDSETDLKVSEDSLENARYKVTIDANGDVASIRDKKLDQELLASPIRLALKADHPVDWPAWNMDWADQKQPPRAFVSGPAKVRIVENGPARVAIEVEREADGSKFVQTVRLATGDAGNRVEFSNVIDWKTADSNLKAVFPLVASNPEATYNWDIGTIRRPNDDEKRYEVASHQWLDLTDKSGAFGVTILSDAKNGSDKPDDSTLRLTLIRTPGLGHHPDGRPGNGNDYADQTTQDWGHHEFVYGVAGHAGDFRAGQTDWQGWRLNQPLLAFSTTKHAGALGKSMSLLKVGNPRLRVLAFKKAENGDDYVVRLVELDGKPQANVHIGFAAPVTAAREINGAEEPVGAAQVSGGELVASFTAFQPRTFAVKLGPAKAKAEAVVSQPVTIPYNRSVASRDGHPGDGGFDGEGRALTGELLPATVDFAGVKFRLAPATLGKPNALVPHGQTIDLPAGNFNRLYLLAAADGDQALKLNIGEQPVDLNIQNWGGFVGQWDTRLWRDVADPIPAEPAAGDRSAAAQRARRIREHVQQNGPITHPEYAGLLPGFFKTAPIGGVRVLVSVRLLGSAGSGHKDGDASGRRGARSHPGDQRGA